MHWLYIAGGGLIGVLLRAALVSYCIPRFSQFPMGTFLANMVGCLLIGLVWALVPERNGNPALQQGLVIGVLGGFTTFSSYTMEGLKMLENQQVTKAFFYVAGSPAIGLALAFTGLALGRAIAQG